jgi:hypothetical protein
MPNQPQIPDGWIELQDWERINGNKCWDPSANKFRKMDGHGARTYKSWKEGGHTYIPVIRPMTGEEKVNARAEDEERKRRLNIDKIEDIVL